MKKLITGLVAIVAIFGAQIAVSRTAMVTGTAIQSIIIDQDYYGGCMVQTDKTLADYGLDCPGGWVSFSCDGTFGNQDIAFRQLDQAQIAMALNKKINVGVDDARKHNGYCYGLRIDVYK